MMNRDGIGEFVNLVTGPKPFPAIVRADVLRVAESVSTGKVASNRSAIKAAMLYMLAFVAISSASVCKATPTMIEGGVVKTTRADYVLYEPPWWFTMTQAPPVVFYLHGLYGNDESKYEKHLAELARRRFAVVFLKWDHPDSRVYYDDVFRRFVTAYQELSNRNVGYWRTRGFAPDIKNYGIIGHSLGGMYALKLAAELGWYERMGLPDVVPKALILQDAGGFGAIFPFVTPRGQRALDEWSFFLFGSVAPTPSDMFWLDDLDMISSRTLLVLLIAEKTAAFQLAKHFDPDSIDFGNATFSGVWSRAWHHTGLRDSRKHAFVVPNGEHWDVEKPTLAPSLPYVNVSANALNAGFGRSLFSSEQSGVYSFRGWMNWFQPTLWTPRSSHDEPWWLHIGVRPLW